MSNEPQSLQSPDSNPEKPSRKSKVGEPVVDKNGKVVGIYVLDLTDEDVEVTVKNGVLQVTFKEPISLPAHNPNNPTPYISVPISSLRKGF